MLKNYTKNRGSKLNRLVIADIETPTNIKVYWINSHSTQDLTVQVKQELHKHTFYEVHFVFDGSATYHTGTGTSYCVQKGEGILFTPHTKHITKQCSPNLLRFTFAFLPQDKNIFSDAVLKAEAFHFTITENLIYCVNALLEEVDRNSYLSSTLIQNHIFEIIVELIRITKSDKYEKLFAKNGVENLVITRAKQYVADNKEKMLECKDVAAHCHFNVKYLSRIFQVQTGIPLLEYIHTEKTKYAEELLRDSTLSLKEVSMQLGFPNEYYFNTFFKRRKGIAPGQFRRLTCQQK